MPKIAIYIDKTLRAQSVWGKIQPQIETVPIKNADTILAIGGDGFMLETLRKTIPYRLPVYGVNCGSVGFLMNEFDENLSLYEKICHAQKISLHSLKIESFNAKGEKTGDYIAINEVSVFRSSAQSARLAISVDDKIHIPELICDGILLATPAGSTAYNFSAQGPIIPIGSNILALTPISPFRPRRWRGALLPDNVKVRIESLEYEKRPVLATADNFGIPDIHRIEICCARENPFHILFDPDHNLEDRILREQFIP